MKVCESFGWLGKSWLCALKPATQRVRLVELPAVGAAIRAIGGVGSGACFVGCLGC